MSGFDPYRLWVEFRVKDETFSGFAELKRSIQSSTASVAALKKELADVRANSLVPARAIEARAEMLRLAKQEAELREQMVLSTNEGERKVLATRINALEITQRDLGLKRQTLAMDEQAAAAEARAAAMAEKKRIAEERASVASARSAAQQRESALLSAGKTAGHVGSNMMWTGAGILGTVAYATQKAADFDQTTFETDLALGGYNRSAAQRDTDMRALQKAAFTASNATGFFSAQQVMDGLKVAATSGMRPIVEKYGMNSFTDIAPALAQYMDILGRLKNEDSETAAKQAVQTAHLFGAYKPGAMAKVWNEASVLSMAMPDEFSRAMTVMGQLGPVGQYLSGMTPAQVMAFTATADQSGLGQGRAGARLKDYVQAIAVTQSAKRERAKNQLGLQAAIDKDGHLDIAKSFEILQNDRKKLGETKFRNLASTAFGQVGIIPAAMMSDTSKSDMYHQNLKVIQDAANNGSLETIQKLLKNFGVSGQEAIAITRLSNDLVEFGQAGIPIATKFFDAINPKLKAFGDWMEAHPDDLSHFVDNAVHVGEELLAVGGALKALSMVAGVYSSVKTLAEGIGFLRAAFTGAKLAGEVEAVASGMEVLGFSLGPVAIGIAAVLATIQEYKDIKDMLDRGKRGERVVQSDYDPTSPLGFAEDNPNSPLYVARRVGLPNVPYNPQHDLLQRLKAAPPQVHIHGPLSVNLPKGSTPDQGRAFLNWLINQHGAIQTAPTVPNAQMVPLH